MTCIETSAAVGVSTQRVVSRRREPLLSREFRRSAIPTTRRTGVPRADTPGPCCLPLRSGRTPRRAGRPRLRTPQRGSGRPRRSGRSHRRSLPGRGAPPRAPGRPGSRHPSRPRPGPAAGRRARRYHRCPASPAGRSRRAAELSALFALDEVEVARHGCVLVGRGVVHPGERGPRGCPASGVGVTDTASRTKSALRAEKLTVGLGHTVAPPA